MQIQEGQQQVEFEDQTSSEFFVRSDDYARRYEQKQREKTFFQTQSELNRKPLWIMTLIFSSIGFFLTLAAGALLVTVLAQDNNYSNFSWWEPRVTETAIGLLCSTGAMVLCGVIFVLSVVALSMRIRK